MNQTEFSREWLDQKLALIRPRIDGLKIVPVHVGPAASDYCYVVEVPSGDTAHQARDHRYYRRRNFESSPMEDYEVREVMNRRKNPAVGLVVAKLHLSRIGDGSSLFFRVENTSTVLARQVCVQFDVPMKIGEFYVWVEDGNYDTGKDDEGAHWHLSGHFKGQPLFPKSTLSMKLPFSYGQLKQMPERLLTKLRYRIYADEMPFVEGSFAPEEITDWFFPA